MCRARTTHLQRCRVGAETHRSQGRGPGPGPQTHGTPARRRREGMTDPRHLSDVAEGGEGTGHLCLMPSSQPSPDRLPPRPRFPPAAEVGTQKGGTYSKRGKGKWGIRLPHGSHATFYHSRAALAPKGARAGTQVHDKVSTRQRADDDVKTSPQGVKFGYLKLSTCFHWRHG